MLHGLWRGTSGAHPPAPPPAATGRPGSSTGHDVVDAPLQVSQLAQRANDPPTRRTLLAGIEDQREVLAYLYLLRRHDLLCTTMVESRLEAVNQHSIPPTTPQTAKTALLAAFAPGHASGPTLSCGCK